MGDVKQIRRLQTNASFAYAEPGGVPTVELGEHKEGGSFDLHPLVQYEGDTATLFFPHPDNPSFSIALKGDADAWGRLGRAAVGVQRKITGQGGDEE